VNILIYCFYRAVILISLVTLHSTRLRLPEDDAGTLKHVRVLMIYKILLIHICYTYVGLHNKPYKMHGTYAKKKLSTDVLGNKHDTAYANYNNCSISLYICGM
jgi:hypothetical protein